MNVPDFLKEVLLKPSPSGFEHHVTNIFRNYMEFLSYRTEIDIMGNVIAYKKGEGAYKLMLIAHADEVGFMVTYIDNKGYLYFQPIGGVDVELLPGIQVEIYGKRSRTVGVICKRLRRISIKETCQQMRFEDLWIDIGAKDKDDAMKYVQVGDFITYKTNIELLPNNLILSRALDDKIGLAVLAEVASYVQGKKTKCDIYFVASVQEELGFRGATSVANKINPDECIAIDVTHATDCPQDTPFLSGEINLGDGAVIAIGPNINQTISTKMLQTADERSIKRQIEAIPRTTATDARNVQVSGNGVRTALLSIPCRYMHSPVEIVSMDDFHSAINILIGFLS